MHSKSLQVNAAIQILKPPHEVFEAIVDPAQMTNYFISESTGRMEEGKGLVWKFPEFDEEAPVRVGSVEQDRLVSFYWDIDGVEMLTEIRLAPHHGGASTVVRITEKEGANDEAGISWLKGNTEGWANFLACLKAWLEYGINLRKGAFDFRKG